MMNFLLLDILDVSQRMLWKNENSVYRLQKAALVRERFKFEICVKNMQMRWLMMSYTQPNITSCI